MKKLTLTFMSLVLAATIGVAQTWTSLGTDSEGDGSTPSAPDAKSLAYRYDETSDSLWFRIEVNGTIRTMNYGLNIVLNVDGAGSTATWWGSNGHRYNRLITAWITSGQNGTVGLSDPAGVSAANYTNLQQNNLSITVDQANNAYIVGIKRTDLTTGSGLKAGVIAAVGTNALWNDDVPNVASGPINIGAPTSVNEINLDPSVLQVYPNPSKGAINISFHEVKSDHYHFQVYNALGAVVYDSGQYAMQHEHETTLDLSQFPTGIYYLKAAFDNQVVTKRLIKK